METLYNKLRGETYFEPLYQALLDELRDIRKMKYEALDIKDMELELESVDESRGFGRLFQMKHEVLVKLNRLRICAKLAAKIEKHNTQIKEFCERESNEIHAELQRLKKLNGK